ncbi:protein FAM83A isoform 1-T2 [Anableps anableps]
MSNSQEQSLNENVIFLPVDESSPQFLHSEREREAVERLLNSGPEAFYSSIGPELSGCFLSPQEVSQISIWAQNYHFTEPLVEHQNGPKSSFDSEKICSTYDPYCWDVPVPELELGWPEKPPWVPTSSVAVHSSSPAEGDLQVREVIRQHLQAAKSVIAVVTDQLTDNTIIFDLHTAASRGVAVYIILNQRSLQENFTLNRLRHPYIRVRVLGGKTFCSRTGKMVVGEMKDNFILVDLEAVIHGSYSLTWTGVHLHRQLITVLRGPVVESFDREFRILFADSDPVPDTWGVTAGTQVYNPYQTKDFSHLRLLKQLSAESDLANTPSPPEDVLLDWEAMGVVHRDSSQPASLLSLHKENVVEKMSQLEINEDKPTVDRFTHNEHLVWNKRIHEDTSPITSGVTDNSKTINNTEVLSTNSPATEGIKRPKHTIERSISRELSVEKQPNKHDWTVTRLDVPPELATTLYSKRRSIFRMESFLEDENKTDYVSSGESSSSSTGKKPLILRVPHAGNFSSVSDIMKRLMKGTPRMLRKEVNSTMSDRTQSMMNLSEQTHNDSEDRVPRFLTSLNPDQMTPALALMQKRNDGLKSALNRPSANFMPTERPRSSTLNSSFYRRKLISDKEEPVL